MQGMAGSIFPVGKVMHNSCNVLFSTSGFPGHKNGIICCSNGCNFFLKPFHITAFANQSHIWLQSLYHILKTFIFAGQLIMFNCSFNCMIQCFSFNRFCQKIPGTFFQSLDSCLNRTMTCYHYNAQVSIYIDSCFEKFLSTDSRHTKIRKHNTNILFL